MSVDTPAIGTEQDRYAVEIQRDVRIPTADPQVTLSADVYLPVGAGSVPALVTAYPYRKDYMGVSVDAHLRWFAQRGYACLIVDLQGTGSSDGTRRPKCDPGEGDDAVAAIEWAADQPWCSGNVGMWGISYGGIITMRAASRRPPHLKAIIPMMATLDPGWAIHPNGARGDMLQLIFWGGSMLASQLLPPLLNYTSVEEQRRWKRRLHDTEPFIMDLARHGPNHPTWQGRMIDAELITVPALCVSAWRDVFPDAMIHAYERMQGPKKLLIGPWGHTFPEASRFQPISFLSIALRWWDHWLREADNGVQDEPPISLYMLDARGENSGWRSFESWPPAKSELMLTTGLDTTMIEPAEGMASPSEAIAEYFPDPTIGALSGLQGLGRGEFGLPLDQHDDDARAVSFTSGRLQDDLIICGRTEVSVRLDHEQVTPASPVERIVVRLTEVDPEGRSVLITSGVACPEEPADTHRITLSPTSYRVHAGQRLRVVVSDSDFPRLTPLPNPRPIRVAGIELSVPTVLENEGTLLDMPTSRKPTTSATTPGLGAGFQTAENWTITRDPLHDGLEVAIGARSAGVHTSQGHFFRTHSDLAATVRRETPDAAVSSGTSRIHLTMSTGESITVTATVRCTQTSLWARGEVTVDDLQLFTRIWEAPLGHAHQQR